MGVEGPPPWSVLLLGGAAGAGKSTSAAEIARLLGVSWLSADAIWAALKAATSHETHPAFHHFEPSQRDIDAGAEHLLRLHRESAEAISATLAAFVDWQLSERSSLVLEGAWITPEFAAKQVQHSDGRVRAAFIHEVDASEVLESMMARAVQPKRTERRSRISEMSWRYGEWLREACGSRSLPIVPARPRQTLVERIISAASRSAAAAEAPRSRSDRGAPE